MKLRAHILVLFYLSATSILLYVGAFLTPTFRLMYATGPSERVYYGYEAFFLALAGPLRGDVSFFSLVFWLANPLYYLTGIFLWIRQERKAFVTAGLAAVLASGYLLFSGLLMLVGYFLWYASFWVLVLTVACCVFKKTSAESEVK